MNWSLVLSEYPRTLLDSALAAKILTLVERNGLSTQDELTSQLDLKPQTLSAALIDLHQNRLIEFGRNSVRVSLRGKWFLDCLSVDGDIVEDVLKDLPVEKSEQSGFTHLIHYYRQQAFPQYLNSIATMRAVRLFIGIMEKPSLGKARLGNREASETASAMNFTALLRDLRNWRVHREPPRSVFDHLREETRIAITGDEPIDQVFTKCSKRYSNLYGSAIKHKKIYLKFMDTLNDFQESWQRDDWFDSWVDVVHHAEGSEAPTYNSFIKLLQVKSRDTGTSSSEAAWWSELAAEDTGDDVWTHFFLAVSLDDLSKRTGIPIERVQAIVRNVQERSTSLLEDKAVAINTSKSASSDDETVGNVNLRDVIIKARTRERDPLKRLIEQEKSLRTVWRVADSSTLHDAEENKKVKLERPASKKIE
jgi:hypothetical protein